MDDAKMDLESRHVSSRVEEVLSQIKKKELKRGDIVYCYKECEDVIFLEPPSDKAYEKYKQWILEGDKDPPFTGRIKYKTFHGTIGFSPVACIVKISVGNFYAEQEFKGKNYEVISKNKEILARQAGFRVERIKLDSSILLRIYGDTQEEVDDFVSLVCQKDFQIY